MRQLGLAFQTFHDNKQVFPPANHIWRQPNTGYITDQRGWSWAIDMLPYIEQQALYDTLDTSSTGGPLIPFPLITYSNGESSPNMHAVATATHLAAFSCPSFAGKFFADVALQKEAISNFKVISATHHESYFQATIYGVNQQNNLNPYVPLYPYNPVPTNDVILAIHPDGFCYPGSKLSFSNIKDGTTHTFMMAETKEQYVARWTFGWEMSLVGLPTVGMSQSGNVPPDAVTFSNAYNLRYWHPYGFNGSYGEEGTIPVNYRTFLNHRYEELPDWPYLSWPYQSAGLALGPQYPIYTIWPQEKYGPSSDHPATVNHVLADGSARPISKDIDVAMYMFLITRNNSDPNPEITESHN